MTRVFVARKTCGHIVAAFPVHMDMNCKAEILKQFTKAGYDLEQASEAEVMTDFALTCDCGKPPLLKAIDEAENWKPEEEGNPAEELTQEEINNDGGAGEEDVSALANEDEAGAFDPEPELPL